MTILQMHYLLTLSETKKIYQAAQKCFISQSAFSQNLMKLEEELGAQLFIRNGNEWNPTSAGIITLNSIRQIVEIYGQMQEQIEEITSSKKHTITLGMCSERALLILTQIYPRFLEKYPGYSIQLIEGLHSYLQDMTSSESIDLSLTALPERSSLRNYPTLSNVPLCDEELVLIMPKKHRLALLAERNGSVAIKELDREPFIQYERRKNLYHVLHTLFKAQGIQPRDMLFFNGTSTCIGFVQKGLGISIVPKSLAERKPDIAVARLDPPLYWELNIVYGKTKKLSPAENYLIILIKEALQKLLSD